MNKFFFFFANALLTESKDCYYYQRKITICKAKNPNSAKYFKIFVEKAVYHDMEKAPQSEVPVS